MRSRTVLFYTTWRHANANRWLAEGFEQVGCKVVRVGPKPDDHWMHVGWEDGPKVDVVIPVGEPAPIGDLADQYAADMVLLWDRPETVYTGTDRLRCPLAIYVSEGWPRDFEAASALPPPPSGRLVCYYTQMPFGVRGHALDMRRRGWLYLPGACHPVGAHPRPDIETDRRVDVCLLGGEYEWRTGIVQRLRDEGFSALVGQRNIKGYADAAGKCLTFVCHTNQQAYVEWRVFEAMAMGSIVLLDGVDDRVRVLLEELKLEAGKHLLTLDVDRNGEPEFDCVVDRVTWLRSHPAAASAIREAAYLGVLGAHTYADRAATILRDLGVADRVVRAGAPLVAPQNRTRPPALRPVSASSWSDLCSKTRARGCIQGSGGAVVHEWLFQIVSDLPAEAVIVDIGAGGGGHMALCARVSQEQWASRRIVLVDPDPSICAIAANNLLTVLAQPAWQSVGDDQKTLKVPLVDSVQDAGYLRVEQYVMNSSDVAAVWFAQPVAVQAIDLLHIDGAPDFDRRRYDIERFAPCVCLGGLLWIEDADLAPTRRAMQMFLASQPPGRWKQVEAPGDRRYEPKSVNGALWERVG